jgi:ankyrin repeat protein
LQNGFTALMWAAGNGHTDCVGLLLAAGANREAKNIVRRRSFFRLRLLIEFFLSALHL